MERLKPPEGYRSWLHYVITTMDCRTPHLDSCDESPWGRIVQGYEMRHEAATELDELETVIRLLWTKQSLSDPQRKLCEKLFH